MAKKKTSGKVLDRKALAKKYSGSGMATNVLGNNSLWLPSRFLLLNHTMGGGIPYGKMVEIHGLESSGKSLLSFDFAYCAQQLGGTVIWVDAEAAFTNSWAEHNGLDPDNVELYVETAVERISDYIMDMTRYWRSQLTNNEPILLVLDSIASLECESNLDSEQSDAKAEMGNRAKAIDKMLRIRNPLLSELGVCTIFINQLRSKIGATKFEDPFTTPGGKAVAFYASIRLAVFGGKQILGKIRGKETRVGRVSSIRVIKNKVAPPMPSIKSAEVYFNPKHEDHDIGFNKYFGLPELLVEAGIVDRKKGASWYTYKGTNIANGDKKFLQLLMEDETMRRKLIRKAGINTISTFQKKLNSINENLYPVSMGKQSKEDEDE